MWWSKSPEPPTPAPDPPPLSPDKEGGARDDEDERGLCRSCILRLEWACEALGPPMTPASCIMLAPTPEPEEEDVEDEEDAEEALKGA